MFKNFVEYHVRFWARDRRKASKDSYKILSKIFDNQRDAFVYCTDLEKSRKITDMVDSHYYEMLEVIGIVHHEVFDKLIYSSNEESYARGIKSIMAEHFSKKSNCKKGCANSSNNGGIQSHKTVKCGNGTT